MKKFTLLLLLIFSFTAYSQSTINITTSEGKSPTQKWVNITTAVHGSGTQVWGQGDGTYGSGSGFINLDIVLEPGIYYVNCYDRNSDGWDETLISVTAYNIVLGNNNGVSPTDSNTNDVSSAWEIKEKELEASFQIVVPNVPSCIPPRVISNVVSSLSETTIDWDQGSNDKKWVYEYGVSPYIKGSGASTTTSTSSVSLNLLTPGETYNFYVTTKCNSSLSAYDSLTFTMPIAGDTFELATTLPFTISPEGTGCSTSNLSIDFSTLAFTASGLKSNSNTIPGVDAFFKWTATSVGLRWWGNETGSGFPYISILDTSGKEIDKSEYKQSDKVLQGWAIGDKLIIRIYDFGSSKTKIKFCLELSPATCAPPLAISNVLTSPSETTIDWDHGRFDKKWVYEYGVSPYTKGSGTSTKTSTSSVSLNLLTPGETYDFYIATDCGSDLSVYHKLTFSMPIAGDTFEMRTTLPFTISPEGTGCSASSLEIDFPNLDFTASGLKSKGIDRPGLDCFFKWTATSDGLRWWGDKTGKPYISILDTSGNEIDNTQYLEKDALLHGWAKGDELVIRIYDFGSSKIKVKFCLEYYSLKSKPNCAENVSPMSGATVAFDNDGIVAKWDAPSSGIAHTDYQVLFGRSLEKMKPMKLSSTADANTKTYKMKSKLYGVTFYYSIVPRNDGTPAIGCVENSFTVENASVPFSTDFSSYPAGFAETQGELAKPSLSLTTSDWTSAYFLNKKELGRGTKVRIRTNSIEEYLMSQFDLSSGTNYLNMNVGITKYNSSQAYEAGMDGDDYVAILMTENDGDSWRELHRWNDTSGLTNTSQPMPEIIIPSNSSNVKIALYANSKLSSGDYHFHVTDFKISKESLKTEKITLEGFTLFPTIVKDVLKFKSENKVDAITVFNLLGQKVFYEAPDTNNSSINLSELRPGVYIVIVSAEAKIRSYKIIKN